MGNKKILIEALKNLNKAKAPVKKKDIIYDKEGQWKYPGQPTRIPSNEITMQGVPYPVLGKGSDGSEQMMYPGAEYTFPGADYVDEYPQMKKGGSKKFSNNLEATNRLFKKNSLFKKSPLSKANPLFKKKNYKKKIYDPQSMYFQGGGDVSPVQIVPTYIPGVSPGSPEEWAKKIKAAETQIGPPTQWLPEDYNYIQNILQDYYVWRQQNPNAAPADKTNNAMSDYMVPIPYHLRDVVEQKEFPEIPVKKEAEIADVVTGTETLCLDEGRCLETDQIQEMLDRGSVLPKEVVNTAWDVVGQVHPEEGVGISAATAWKNRGVPTLASRLGMSNPSNCMWAAGSGWMCEPEFSDVSKTAFESNDKFINAVNKGTVPFTRVTKTSDPNFDAQEKGLLETGDIINIKGPGTSHAMTFSHYREDGKPIYVDSNGNAADFDFNVGMWSGMKPGNGRVAYVSRFSPEMEYAEKIKELEEKARTNPTYYTTDDQTMVPTGYRTGGFPTDISIATLNRFVRGGTAEECEEGYKWDETKGQCVPLIDVDWMENWYANRTLPLEEIPNKKYVNLMKKRLPQYNPDSTLLEELANTPPIEYQDVIADNPNVEGEVTYDKNWNPDKILLKRSLLNNPVKLNQVYNQERSTAVDVDEPGLFDAQNMVIDPGLVMFEDRWGDLKGAERDAAEDNYNYLTDPEQDNIHSLIFEERYKRDLKPTQVITEEDINNWRTEAEASGALDRSSPNFDDTLYTLFKLAKDNKALMNWFNQLASNEMPVDKNAPQYAQQGGSMGYQIGDEVDEATMQKLKKQGYTFEKIK